MDTIKELVTAVPIKVQIVLEEDATDQEVMTALDDTCRGLATHEGTGQKLKWILGKILIAVRERKLWAGGYGTFEAWLDECVLNKYKLGRSTVLEAVQVLDAIPEAPKMKVPTANLVMVARAVRCLPEGQVRERFKTQLLSEAKRPVSEFREEVHRRFALRRHGRKMSTIVLHVAAEVADAWLVFVGARNGGEVLTELIGFGRKRVRKSAVA